MGLIFNGTEGNDTINGSNEDDLISTGGGNDTVKAGAGNDFIYGEAGDDKLYGEDGNDMLDGGSGNDSLYGGKGDDWLIGGTGNDRLEGGVGDDTYFFDKGWGNDTIYDYTSGGDNDTDVIRFGAGITLFDIKVTSNGTHLFLTHKETGDTITVNNHFSGVSSREDFANQYYAIDKVLFADGTGWNKEMIFLLTQTVTNGDDFIYGFGGADILHMGGGNDTVKAGTGNDFIYGETGDDRLWGEDGNDMLDGGSGNDSLYGGKGDDWLIGGTGNDRLEGGVGDDTYFFDKGWGNDTIYDYTSGGDNDTDVIRFGAGITLFDIKVTSNGTHLFLTHKETGDTITVNNHFSGVSSREDFANQYYAIDKVLFADGTGWNQEMLFLLATASANNAPTSFTASDGGHALNDVMMYSSIDSLISSMAAFATPESAGSTSLLSAQQNASQPLVNSIAHGY